MRNPLHKNQEVEFLQNKSDLAIFKEKINCIVVIVVPCPQPSTRGANARTHCATAAASNY